MSALAPNRALRTIVANARELHAAMTIYVERHNANVSTTKEPLMTRQRIALRTKHFDDCLEVCEPDAKFLEAFGKVRDLFAAHAREHECKRSADDVSAEDIERQLLREYVFATVWARVQVLANGVLIERLLAESPRAATDAEHPVAGERCEAREG